MADAIFGIILSILVSFVLGSVAILFFGGRTALNYMVVKASRGRKVLVFAKTKFGWRTFTAKKKENTLKWKYDKQERITNIEDGDLTRYMRIDMIFVDADRPLQAIKLKEGQLFPDGFDPETFNNLLVRLATRPTEEGFEDIKKLLKIAVGGIVLLLFGVVMVYMKLNELTGGSGGVV